MNDPVTRTVIAAVLAVVVCLVALQRQSLSRSGAIAAVVVGVAIVLGGGWWTGVMLMVFFVSSSILSALPSPVPNDEGTGVPGAKRNAIQVLANGGFPAAMAVGCGLLLLPLFSTPSSSSLTSGSAHFLIACAGGLAAVMADTWATEIGGRFGGQPRTAYGFMPVAIGTSGGVTVAGLIATVVAALVMGAMTLALPFPNSKFEVLAAVMVAGVYGSIADSLLGSTLQARYLDPTTGNLVDEPPTRGAKPAHGWRWMTNDVVNFLCCAKAGLLAAVVLKILEYIFGRVL